MVRELTPLGKYVHKLIMDWKKWNKNTSTDYVSYGDLHAIEVLLVGWNQGRLESIMYENPDPRASDVELQNLSAVLNYDEISSNIFKKLIDIRDKPITEEKPVCNLVDEKMSDLYGMFVSMKQELSNRDDKIKQLIEEKTLLERKLSIQNKQIKFEERIERLRDALNKEFPLD